MIEISGYTERDFVFPADPTTTLAYYDDLDRIVKCLSHINLVDRQENEARIFYNTKELGAYQVYIYCDLETRVDHDTNILHVQPAHTRKPIKEKNSWNSTTCHGVFRSESHFKPYGDHTRVAYQVKLFATLPPPKGLMLVPGPIINRIAENIMNSRMDEIIDGFVEKSIAYFPAWRAQQEKA